VTSTTPAAAADMERMAAALVVARRALVTGFAAADAETAALACDLAEAVHAAVDPGDDECSRVAGPTIARIGAVTADPAELRDRADLVLFWFCEPDAVDPAFSAEWVAPPTAAGRPRRVIAVGPHPAGGAPTHVPVDARAAFDLARLVHAAVVGLPVPAPPAPLAAAVAAVQAAVTEAACVALVTAHADPVGLEPWSLVGLVRAIAHRTPAFEVPLAGGGPGTAVCTWRYGAAGAIAAADRLGGAFLPAEADARRLIEREEADCVVVVGPVPAAIEAAITARGPRLTVIRADAASLPALVAAVRAARVAEGRP
jgi:formylmethanofuran dehydrogenase subunit B